MKTIFAILSIIVGALYYVLLYAPGYILYSIARLLLAFAYMLMLQKQKAIDILKYFWIRSIV